MTQYFRLNTPPSPWHRAADVAGQVWEQHQEQKRQEELQRQQEEERRREAQEYQQRLALEVILPTLSQQGRADVGQAIGRGESPWMDPNWVPDQKLPMTQKELPKPQEIEPTVESKLAQLESLRNTGRISDEQFRIAVDRLMGATYAARGSGGGGGDSGPGPAPAHLKPTTAERETLSRITAGGDPDRAALQEITQPQPQPLAELAAKVKQAREGGFTDDEIEKALKARGVSSEEIMTLKQAGVLK